MRDWLPAGRVALLAGRGGAGKIKAGAAAGRGDRLRRRGRGRVDRRSGGRPPGWGRPCPPTGAPVVYASWEDEEDEFARRLSQMSGPSDSVDYP